MKYGHSIVSRRLLIAVMLIILLLILVPAACFGLGKREAPVEEKVRMEEPTEIVFYMLVENPQDPASMIRFRPEAAAAYHLFQDVKAGNGAVRITSDRKFSLPIGEKEVLDFSGTIGIIRCEAELIPAMPVSYRKIGEEEFSFSVDELVSGERVRFQPGQRAIMDVARTEGVENAIMRVREIRLVRKGTFSGLVEIAVPAGK